MKSIISYALVLLACVSGLAQEQPKTNAPVKIPASIAKQHINADAIVTGKVAEVNKAQRLVRLNFEKPFPNQTFTAVIFANKTNLFPEIDKLKDKIVEISGKIADYRGRPEIILTSTNQLRVVEQSDASGGTKP
jgi:DNA/RNA endonuclease YhcR with UshA esterase domain